MANDGRVSVPRAGLPQRCLRRDLCRAIAQEAEYGHWELSRLLLYLGGSRKVWLRRRIIRVERTVWQGTIAQG